MKICYRKSQNNEWSAKPSKDGVYLWRLLPDNPEQEKFCLLVSYSGGSGDFCLVARSDTNDSVIADELSERETRSLILAYLKARNQFFAAAEQNAIERIIAAYPVEDHGLLVNQKNVQLRPADALNSLSDVAEKVRLYRLRLDDGPRIIAADHFYKTPEEVDPDMSVWEKAPERLSSGPSLKRKNVLIFIGITAAAAALLAWALIPSKSEPNPKEPSVPTTDNSADGSDGVNNGVISNEQGNSASTSSNNTSYSPRASNQPDSSVDPKEPKHGTEKHVETGASPQKPHLDVPSPEMPSVPTTDNSADDPSGAKNRVIIDGQDGAAANGTDTPSNEEKK